MNGKLPIRCAGLALACFLGGGRHAGRTMPEYDVEGAVRSGLLIPGVEEELLHGTFGRKGGNFALTIQRYS